MRHSKGGESSTVARIEAGGAQPLRAVEDDHFARRGEQAYAGTHVLLDMWGARDLDDLPSIERALRSAVDAAGATLLHLHLHHFGGGGGVSGVAVLAESHISVHTWPERNYAAFDVFMCGECHPERAADEIQRALRPERVARTTAYRGVVD